MKIKVMRRKEKKGKNKKMEVRLQDAETGL